MIPRPIASNPIISESRPLALSSSIRAIALFEGIAKLIRESIFGAAPSSPGNAFLVHVRDPTTVPPIRLHPTTTESPSTSASLGSHSSQPPLILPRACISSVGPEPRACAREAPLRESSLSLAIDRLPGRPVGASLRRRIVRYPAQARRNSERTVEEPRGTGGGHASDNFQESPPIARSPVKEARLFK